RDVPAAGHVRRRGGEGRLRRQARGGHARQGAGVTTPQRPPAQSRGGPPAPRGRKALSHLGGPTPVEGGAAIGEVLRSAFDVEPDDVTSRAHVHGFHSYPARLHPVTAHRALKGLLTLGGELATAPTVLDPFCGSGTVLVEARLLGARAIGTDV